MKSIDKLLESAKEQSAKLGYPADELELLFLIPFIQVAWAEGFVQQAERKSILKFAKTFKIKAGNGQYEQLKIWLDERPSDDFFTRSNKTLMDLIDGMPNRLRNRVKDFLLSGCVEVARASRDIGIVKNSPRIRREEHEQLQQISQQLGLNLELN